MATKRMKGALTLAAALALVLGLTGLPMSAQGASGGELGAWGPLVDSRGNEIAHFEMFAAESSIPEFVPNGGFEEGEAGEEWGGDLGLNRFGFGEEGLPDPYDGEFSFQLIGSEGSAGVCVGHIEPGVDYLVSFAYFVDPYDVGDGMYARLGFWDTEEPCNGEELGEPVHEGPFTHTEAPPWESPSFTVTAPPGDDLVHGLSAAVIFDVSGPENTYLDNVSLTSEQLREPAGVGNVFFGIHGHALSACSTYGPEAHLGHEGILGEIGCDDAGAQMVSINACRAQVQFHGFVHSEAPNTTFLGQAVVEVTLNVNRSNAAHWGTLDVKIYNPKDVIRLKGRIPRPDAEDPEQFYMSTCGRLG